MRLEPGAASTPAPMKARRYESTRGSGDTAAVGAQVARAPPQSSR
eukprot:CAMPEP_0170262470 /NCGR_PEP_ID=MMETSP0116_2-20130129/31119_1 /TAXON_ID=400756 /ORGANISM="Durinskia baltica, Strain CSIRO CS-38" /LENGTH=44 /DNA_ID= /DNA_START= /DNA_END= /DNA_ORIENTATION=